MYRMHQMLQMALTKRASGIAFYFRWLQHLFGRYCFQWHSGGQEFNSPQLHHLKKGYPFWITLFYFLCLCVLPRRIMRKLSQRTSQGSNYLTINCLGILQLNFSGVVGQQSCNFHHPLCKFVHMVVFNSKRAEAFGGL